MARSLEDLAAAWLANERLYSGRDPDDHSLPERYDLTLAGDVDDLVLDDPHRGVELVEKMLHLAEDETDLKRVGIGPLENLLRHQGEELASWVSDKADASARFRFALGSCWPFDPIRQVVDRLGLHKGETHTYWTVGIRVRCGREASASEVLDAKLQPDLVGGQFQQDGRDQVTYMDYWARDHIDAERVGERLIRTLLKRLGAHGCTEVSRTGPERTWSGTRPGIDRPARTPV
ncbi:MAG TPA: hypothetical protein VGG90_12540 [Candidatus Dormibacteraeota bacterium]|jgi:hypothetical protein